MYAECPHCNAIFRVSQKILEMAGGKVRCGECKVVFQAVTADRQQQNTPLDEQLINSAPVEITQELEVQIPEQEPRRPPSSVTESGLHVNPLEDTLSGQNVTELPKFLPAEIKPPQYRPVRPRLKYGRTIAVFLLLLLMSQYLLANRADLSEDPYIRPVLKGVCQIAGCEVRPHRNVAQIELLNHGIYSHPTVENALMIKAVMANHASFAQPYPVIELSFSDIQGRTVTLRRFGPQEYLDPEVAPTVLMPSGATVSASLQVVDPGKTALAFEFRLL